MSETRSHIMQMINFNMTKYKGIFDWHNMSKKSCKDGKCHVCNKNIVKMITVQLKKFL